jgi:Ni/Co efflux regulator RcnB
MRNQTFKPAILAAVALAFAAAGPIASAQDHPDDHHVMKADDHRDDHKDEHRDDQRNDDPVARYRHDHPHSSARCHDGFFTSTRDRDHACGKHGGIDVWLAL